MKPPVTAWMSAGIGGASALAGVVLAVAVAQSDPQGMGMLVGLGAALVLGAAGAGFVAVWQLAPAPKVVRVKVPAPQIPAPPTPEPPPPRARLEGLPGLIARLDRGKLLECSDELEAMGAEPGPLAQRVSPATLEALEAGQQPEQWVWVVGGAPRVLRAKYLADEDGCWVSLEDHSELQRCTAELRDKHQSLSLALDLLRLGERPEPAIARAFMCLNGARAALRSGSETATRRSVDQLRQLLTHARLPAIVAALEGPPETALRDTEAALRELEELAQRWLPAEEGGTMALREHLAHHLAGRPAPRILAPPGTSEVTLPAIHAVLGKLLPTLLGTPAQRTEMGLDPEGLLRMHQSEGVLELHLDGPGVDMNAQRVLHADPSLRDEAIVRTLLEPGPNSPFPPMERALGALREAGWDVALHPGEPSGPTTRRLVIRLIPPGLSAAA